MGAPGNDEAKWRALLASTQKVVARYAPSDATAEDRAELVQEALAATIKAKPDKDDAYAVSTARLLCFRFRKDPSQRGRHDVYTPKGAVLVGGEKDPDGTAPGNPGELVVIGPSIAITPKTGQETTALEFVLDELSFQKDSTFWTEKQRAATRAAYKVLQGFEPGEEWRGALAHEISVEVQVKVQERLRGAEDRRRLRFGLPPLPLLPPDGPIELSGIRGRHHSLAPSEILALVQKRAVVPRWVTSAVVESLIAGTGRPGGRGGTMTAMQLIDKLAAAQEKKKRKRRK